MQKLNNHTVYVTGQVIGGFSFQLTVKCPEPNSKKQKKIFENDLSGIASIVSIKIQESDWGKKMMGLGLQIGAYSGNFIGLPDWKEI